MAHNLPTASSPLCSVFQGAGEGTEYVHYSMFFFFPPSLPLSIPILSQTLSG